MKNRIILFIALCISIVSIFFAVSPVQARVYPTISVSIIRNLNTRHFYFVPTYVPCLNGPTQIRIINRTESMPVVQLENYVHVVVPAYSSVVETEYIGRNSHWVLLEPGYLGGNAYLYFRRCGFGYSLPTSLKNPQPQPYQPPYIPIRHIDPRPPIYNPYHRLGAICNDMTRSFAIGRGACSFHRGVNHWLYS